MGFLKGLGNIFSAVTAPIQAVVNPLSEVYKARQERKAQIEDAKVQLKIAKLTAEAARWQQSAEITANWDMEAMRQSRYSWKDEWLTIILTLPFVGAFFPVAQDYVLRGFQYLSQVPYWYMLCFIGIVAASFGLRWLFSKKPAADLVKAQIQSAPHSSVQARTVHNMNPSDDTEKALRRAADEYQRNKEFNEGQTGD